MGAGGVKSYSADFSMESERMFVGKWVALSPALMVLVMLFSWKFEASLRELINSGVCQSGTWF